MKTTCIFVVVFLVASSIIAQEASEYNFGLLRQEDDIISFKEKDSISFYNKLKYFSINKKSFASLGGSWRFQSESFTNEQFKNIPSQDNIWYFNRILLHAHLRVNDRFEVFGEINNSLVIDKIEISPVDKDVLAFNQLFIKYKFNKNWNISIGRENLKLGAKRLVDVREGPNVRRSFDLAQINYTGKRFVAKGFFAVPIHPKPEIFDNDFLEFDEFIFGIYSTLKFNPSANLDLYTFYQKDDNVVYNSGSENERRISIGARYFGTYKSLTYNNEMVYQYGKFGHQNIKAWTMSFQLENKTKVFNIIFNVGVKTEMISGDKDATDGTLGTFDALYPRGAYFGRVARFGPSNLIDIHPYINTKFGSFSVEMDFDTFWRFSNADGVYNAALLLEYPDVNNERFIANQFGAIFGYEFNKNIGAELEYNIILPGSFLDQSNRAAVLHHMVLTTEVKF